MGSYLSCRPPNSTKNLIDLKMVSKLPRRILVNLQLLFESLLLGLIKIKFQWWAVLKNVGSGGSDIPTGLTGFCNKNCVCFKIMYIPWNKKTNNTKSYFFTSQGVWRKLPFLKNICYLHFFSKSKRNCIENL